MSTAPANLNFHNCGTATVTGHACTLIHLQERHIITFMPLAIQIIGKGSAIVSNGGTQNWRGGFSNFSPLVISDGIGFAGGVNTSGKQYFVRINIAQASQYRLVKYSLLNSHFTISQLLLKVAWVKFFVKRLNAKTADASKIIFLIRPFKP